MTHAEHVALLRGAVESEGGTWADFGSGRGAFTLALAELIGPTGRIVSIDRDGDALRHQAAALQERFPGLRVDFREADFTRAIDLPALDGLVVANALHFHRSAAPIVARLASYLRPGGIFAIVEYGAERGNPWVPHPISFRQWQDLARSAGLSVTRLLWRRPSSFMGEIYSAASRRPLAPVVPDEAGVTGPR